MISEPAQRPRGYSQTRRLAPEIAARTRGRRARLLREALFSHAPEWAGLMIVADARRVRALKREIAALDQLRRQLQWLWERLKKLSTMSNAC